MKKTKNLMVWMLLFSMIMVSFTGCGSRATAETEASAETPAASAEAPDFEALKAGEELVLSIGYASAEGTASDLSYEQIDKVISGEVGDFNEKISAAYEKAGFKLLKLYSARQYRVMSTNKVINNIEDFKGIRIRTMENKYHMNFWNSLGASATPLNFAELYLALQQGVVDKSGGCRR